MYEHRREWPLPRKAFLWRLAKHVAAALLVVLGSLVGGMGPVESPATPGGKLFAGLYALYAGMVFLVVASLILAPVVHRVLHRFHWDDKG